MEITPMNMQILDTRRDASGGYKVDVSRGERVGRVSSEWFSRPADQRYLSLNELARSVRDRADRSRTRVVESAMIHVEASRGDPERLALMLPGSDKPVPPIHWSFGQLASQVGAPAAYLRQLPAALAGINRQYGLTANRAEQIKTLETDDGRVELRAVTSPDYGRIFDHELVEAVQRIAGNGTGDTRWKVPGVLDWSTGIYNPRVDISTNTTTLYASDRDVFLFLVDDLNPIEAGRLPDGSPDLYFRGFYCWNSEVGATTLGMASFYLRAVCQNRNLWGVEDFEEIIIRHSKYASSRFALGSWSGNGRLMTGIIRWWPIRPHSVLALRFRRPRWCGLRCHGSVGSAGMSSVNLPEASLGPAAFRVMRPYLSRAQEAIGKPNESHPRKSSLPPIAPWR
jgi:hypothetical protein